MFDHLVWNKEYVHEEVALDASLAQSHEASDTTHLMDRVMTRVLVRVQMC